MRECSMTQNRTILSRFKTFFFLYTFVNWGKVYLEDHSLSMIDFIEWLLV